MLAPNNAVFLQFSRNFGLSNSLRPQFCDGALRTHRIVMSTTCAVDSIATIATIPLGLGSTNVPRNSKESIVSRYLAARFPTRSVPVDTFESNQKLRRSWIRTRLLECISYSEDSDETQYLDAIAKNLVESYDYARLKKHSLTSRYIELQQLFAALPLYLGPMGDRSQSPTELAYAMSQQLAAIVQLDWGLDGELYDLLHEDKWIGLAPGPAIYQSLNLDLTSLAVCLQTVTANDQTIPVKPAQSTSSIDAQLTALWNLASQLRNQTSHIHIPPNLAIAKVSWHRVRENWNKIQSLLATFTLGSQAPIGIEPSTIQENQLASGKGKASSVESPTLPTSAEIQDFIEIRSSNDPCLSDSLNIQLETCRATGSSLSLAVFRLNRSASGSSSSQRGLKTWQRDLLDQARIQLVTSFVRGFLTDDDEIVIVIEEYDRAEATAALREVINAVEALYQPKTGMVETEKLGIVCGFACVESPSRSFRFEQLTSAAWRCLAAARNQGPGTVKSIEVF